MAPLPGGSVATLLWDIAQGAFPALPAYWSAVAAGRLAGGPGRCADDRRRARGRQGPASDLWPDAAGVDLAAGGLALAHTQDLAGAQALVNRTPADCYLCLRVRGQIAAATGDATASDRWFKEAVRQAPSPPFAYAEWGEALLAQGDTDGAIARLSLAHDKAPQFADPLELWGEALLEKGRPGRRRRQVQRGRQTRPRWGRDHLMWGEALAKLGRNRRSQGAVARGGGHGAVGGGSGRSWGRVEGAA